MKLLASILALLITTIAAAADRPGTRPHPLFSRMDGYSVASQEEKAFAGYEFRTGPGETRMIEGRLVRVGYLRNEGLPAQSSLAVARNHETAVRQLGGQIVAVIGTPDSPVYTTFSLQRGGETVWGEIDTTAGGNDFAITTVTVAAMKQEVTGRTIDEGLVRDGRIALYGILFDTGKATLQPDSEKVLAAIAAMMKGRPDLRIYVVGHTDNVGSLASNLALSEQRAEAVVKALTARHGIAASRMVGKGVGQLAPVAPNTGEEGRQKNRRVEVVAQ